MQSREQCSASPLSEAIGLQHICLYALRHSFITRLVQAGRPLPEVAAPGGSPKYCHDNALHSFSATVFTGWHSCARIQFEYWTSRCSDGSSMTVRIFMETMLGVCEKVYDESGP